VHVEIYNIGVRIGIQITMACTWRCTSVTCKRMRDERMILSILCNLHNLCLPCFKLGDYRYVHVSHFSSLINYYGNVSLLLSVKVYQYSLQVKLTITWHDVHDQAYCSLSSS